ncbi:MULTISPECIES: hypothetical protein [Pseudooceanicola]|nr:MULTISPECIES: hypothetical protein [Pseudooceanicola]
MAAIAARDADRSDVLAAGHADAQIAMIRARVAADRRWSASMEL